MLATYIRYAPKSPKSDFQDLKRAPCGAQIQIGSKEELLTFHINNDNRDANQFRDNGAWKSTITAQGQSPPCGQKSPGRVPGNHHICKYLAKQIFDRK